MDHFFLSFFPSSFLLSLFPSFLLFPFHFSICGQESNTAFQGFTHCSDACWGEKEASCKGQPRPQLAQHLVGLPKRLATARSMGAFVCNARWCLPLGPVWFKLMVLVCKILTVWEPASAFRLHHKPEMICKNAALQSEWTLSSWMTMVSNPVKIVLCAVTWAVFRSACLPAMFDQVSLSPGCLHHIYLCYQHT